MPAHIKSCAECDRSLDCPWASPDLREDNALNRENPTVEDETVAILGAKLNERTDCR